ncbi:GNAT family N-acetyltransferase, partial [Rhodococcus aerolatus]
RLAVRTARAAARSARPPAGWDRPVGEAVVGGRRLVVRLPELADGPAWRAARLRSREALQPWWPVEGDWAAAQSMAHWAEEVALLRGAARRGQALPGIVEVDGRVVGQVGVDAVDLGTGTGEVSVWLDPTSRGGTVLPVAGLLLALAAFGDRLGLDRLVAPVAVGNRAAAAAARSFGFHDEGVLTAHRATSAGWTDHHLYVLANHPDTVESLRARLAALTDPGPA